MDAHRHSTLLDLGLREEGLARALYLAAAVVLGTCLLTLSAKVQVPFWPVPMTMQTLVVLILGMAYGRWLGAATVLAYLAVGAAGFPVFAGTPQRGVGLAYMMGPTGGFLIGFLAAAWVTGALAERGWDRSVLLSAAAMLAGTVTIFIFGLAPLIASAGLQRAVEIGLVPFLASSGLKMALGAALMPGLWYVLGGQRSVRG